MKVPTRDQIRAIVAAIIGILPLLPIVAKELGIDTIPWVAATLVTTAAITRILANPQVNQWIDQHIKRNKPNASSNSDSVEPRRGSDL